MLSFAQVDNPSVYKVMIDDVVVAQVTRRMVSFESYNEHARKSFEAGIGIVCEAGPVGAEAAPAQA